ncbi:beta-13-glucuronyltransferase [Echinococcus granulosus]|uniref:Beta-13-glucuronyltransferase n=1 Tax=Echinococcus granulosus TaxID=6210 RepID=W6UFW6_ECHGR|nr:beta-13-glucuronyltransferase [Echinococcus granulosus]EUB56977.1 beta-13-glucuronyltransferase [Echinococcus granulosus]
MRHRSPVDMADFTVNLNLVLQHPSALFGVKIVSEQEGVVPAGLGFKKAYELEPRACNCREIITPNITAQVMICTSTHSPRSMDEKQPNRFQYCFAAI